MRPRLIVAASVLALFAVPATSFAQVDGSYVGSFYCYQKPKQRAELQLESSRGGKRATGTLTLYDSEDGNKVVETVDLKGQLFERGGFLLELKKHHPGGTQELLKRSLKGTITGEELEAETTNSGCALSLGRKGSRQAQQALRTLESQQRYDRLLATPPERRKGRTKLHGGNQTFEYVDALVTGSWDNAEVEPVDSVNNWLNEQNMKCLVTAEVRWNGNQGTAVVRQFGKKWNVIDCQGSCESLTYKFSGFNGIVTHWGLSKPVPVIDLKNETFATRDLVWAFTYSGSTPSPPTVRIHSWSDSAADSGPGCRLFP